jgi:hypothetical protein
MRVEILIFDRSGSLTLRGKLGPSLFYGLCVWPICGLGGSGGEKSTPSIGREVSMRSQRLTSGSEEDRQQWKTFENHQLL